MTLREVAYYEVVCDDCEVKTGDLGDYSAWSDHGHALDEWRNHEGWVGDDGETLCWKHAPRCHICSEVQEPDGFCTCLDAARDAYEMADGDQRFFAETVRTILLDHYPVGMAVHCHCGDLWPCSDVSAALDAAR